MAMMDVTAHTGSRARRLRRGLAMAALGLGCLAGIVEAQVPPGAPPPPPAIPAVSAAQLETLVAPIALYPDDLLAIILPSATTPLEVVKAQRFLDKRKSNPNLQPDPSLPDHVRNLLNYPEVVKRLSDDLDWTEALGAAVTRQQRDVMAAVQSFRRKVYSAGNLRTDDKQLVVQEKEIIKIVPANPQVIYVPVYQPATVVVAQPTPAVLYAPTPYPVYYYPYPPGAAFATGFFAGAATAYAVSWTHHAIHHHYDVEELQEERINYARESREDWQSHANQSREDWQSHQKEMQSERSQSVQDRQTQRQDAAGQSQAQREQATQQRQAQRQEAAGQAQTQSAGAASTQSAHSAVQAQGGAQAQRAQGSAQARTGQTWSPQAPAAGASQTMQTRPGDAQWGGSGASQRGATPAAGQSGALSGVGSGASASRDSQRGYESRTTDRFGSSGTAGGGGWSGGGRSGGGRRR